MHRPGSLCLALALLSTLPSCRGQEARPCAPAQVDPAAAVVLLHRGEPLAISSARICSTENENGRFLAELHVDPDTPDLDQPADLTLLAGSRPFACRGIGRAAGVAFVSFPLEREDALELARRLGLRARERRSPGQRLLARLERENGSDEGGTIRLRYLLENQGERAVLFLDGDKSRNELGRDNRFDLAVTREGEALATRAIFDFGGLASLRRIEPGASHVFELELADWADCSAPGLYHVRASYAIELHHLPEQEEASTSLADPAGVWDDTLVAECDFRVD